MVCPILCYYLTALRTSKGDISVSTICQLQRLAIFRRLVYRQIFVSFLLHWQLTFDIVFVSRYCVMFYVNDYEVIDCKHERTLLLSSLLFRSTWKLRGQKTTSCTETLVCNNCEITSQIAISNSSQQICLVCIYPK